MKTIKTVTSLLICAQLLSACSDKSFESQINPNNASQDMVGTGDGGGGNAINYKMLESYMIDPNNLDVVKNRLVKIFDVMFEGFKEDNFKPKTREHLSIKNWYLAPLSLKVIPKEVLGIEFTKDRHQQVAIQTKQAIWIDSNIFNKMSDQEKATLVLHEVVMSQYLMRFLKLEEMCELSQKAGFGGCSDDGDVDKVSLKKMSESPAFKPEPSRPLNEKDYEIIRQMTAWLLANEGKMTFESYETYSEQIGFRDTRFPRSSGKDEVGVEVKYTPAEFETAMNRSILTGSIETNCTGDTTKIQRPCLLKLKKLQSADQDSLGQKFQLDLIDQGTSSVIRSITFRVHEMSSDISHDGQASALVHSEQITTEGRVGQAYDQAMINFKVTKDKKLESLHSISFSKLMIVGQKPHPENRSFCSKQVQQVVGKSFADETILIGNAINYDLSFELGSTNCQYN